MSTIAFTLARASGREALPLRLREGVIAGWTGRDSEALEKHIRELEALGVPRPSSTPIFYRVAASRFTTGPAIEVLGDESSGEVEAALIGHPGGLLVGVGSDHTDRKAETYDVSVSKQMCDKPLAPELWAYEDVKGHWDQLVTRSWIEEGGRRVLYQEGQLSRMRTPEDLIGHFRGGAGLDDGSVMFCGTHAAKGGIRPSGRFEFELEDPVLGRAIRHGYDVAVLPIVA